LKPIRLAIAENKVWLPFIRISPNENLVNAAEVIRQQQEVLQMTVVSQMLLVRDATRGFGEGNEILQRPGLARPREALLEQKGT
jgi:hypothetical protein